MNLNKVLDTNPYLYCSPLVGEKKPLDTNIIPVFKFLKII